MIIYLPRIVKVLIFSGYVKSPAGKSPASHRFALRRRHAEPQARHCWTQKIELYHCTDLDDTIYDHIQIIQFQVYIYIYTYLFMFH